MQREVHQGRVDVERLLQLFNTHGTEIAPGSDVVGKDLQLDWLHHKPFPCKHWSGPDRTSLIEGTPIMAGLLPDSKSSIRWYVRSGGMSYVRQLAFGTQIGPTSQIYG